jgi:hypothetical protein
MWGEVPEVSPAHPQELWSQDLVCFSALPVVCIAAPHGPHLALQQVFQQQRSHFSSREVRSRAHRLSASLSAKKALNTS